MSRPGSGATSACCLQGRGRHEAPATGGRRRWTLPRATASTSTTSSRCTLQLKNTSKRRARHRPGSKCSATAGLRVHFSRARQLGDRPAQRSPFPRWKGPSSRFSAVCALLSGAPRAIVSRPIVRPLASQCRRGPGLYLWKSLPFPRMLQRSSPRGRPSRRCPRLEWRPRPLC